MHNPDAIARMRAPPAHVVRKLEIRRLFAFGQARHAEEILGLIDHDERGVFEENLHARREHGLRHGKAIAPDGHGIAGHERVIELRDRAAVDGDGLMFQPCAHLLLLHLRPVFEKIGEQLGRSLNRGGFRHGLRRPARRTFLEKRGNAFLCFSRFARLHVKSERLFQCPRAPMSAKVSPEAASCSSSAAGAPCRIEAIDFLRLALQFVRRNDAIDQADLARALRFEQLATKKQFAQIALAQLPAQKGHDHSRQPARAALRDNRTWFVRRPRRNRRPT